MPEHKLFQIEWDRLDSRLVGQKLFEGLELSFFLDWMRVLGVGVSGSVRMVVIPFAGRKDWKRRR